VWYRCIISLQTQDNNGSSKNKGFVLCETTLQSPAAEKENSDIITLHTCPHQAQGLAPTEKMPCDRLLTASPNRVCF